MTRPAKDTSGLVTIRPAAANDFDVVVVLELEIFGRAAWSPQIVDAEFAALGSSRFIAVAEAGGRLVGYGVVSYVDEVADIQRLAVRTTHRGRGVATGLLDRLLAEAVRLGCECALLEVAADNRAALRVYGARGFAEIAQRSRYYPGDVDALVMELTLPAPSGSDRSQHD
ncbi:MAG: GNAT family N-acetyltransferase [Nocardioidaceae bacterium]|nr:GNAT family N-acetyltransferase [Nocardioidaceae bacterium]